MRVSQKSVNKTLQRQIRKTLAQLVADLKDEEEAEVFLNSFLTEAEHETFAKRLAVAYFLHKGRSYNNIKNNLKVSSATIATVQSTLDSEGIGLAIKKMVADEWANKWSEKIQKFIGK